MPLVKVKPGLSHGYYDTAVQAHAYHRAGDEFDASPAEMESFSDKFILVVEDEPEMEYSYTAPAEDVRKILAAAAKEYATPGARKLAQEHGISLTLSDITGSGRAGKITKADVQRLLDGDAQR